MSSNLSPIGVSTSVSPIGPNSLVVEVERPLDCIVGLGFGTTGTNYGLAAAAKAHVQTSPVPIFLQDVVADAFAGGRSAADEMEAAGTLTVARPLPGRYLSTIGVLEQFDQMWQAREYNRIGVVAQIDHMARCLSSVEDLGYEAVPVRTQGVVDWNSFGCDEYGYDPTSGQPWTRYRWRFLVWDAVAGGLIKCGQLCCSGKRKSRTKEAAEALRVE